MEQPTQNIWARYGFNDNPFDTKALSITNNLPIDKAYIERENYKSIGGIMDYFLAIPGGGRIIVEGDSGVGKTTFVNYHKYKWQIIQKQNRLFSPETEISVQKPWRLEDFIMNALGSLVGQLRLEIGEKKFNRQKILKEILSITGVLIQSDRGLSANVGIPNIAGFGGSLSRSTSVTVGKNLDHNLTIYLNRLVQFIRSLDYRGIILHFNNMELLQRENENDLIDMFEGIRDILQTNNIYFVFVGGSSLFQRVILPSDRVRSIFYDEPIVITPFTEKHVLEIIEERYKILGTGNSWIKPVNDDVILYLYECFKGRIRDVMNTITNLMSRIPEGFVDTLNLDNVMDKLLDIELQKLRNQGLSDTDLEILKGISEEKKFNNSMIVANTSKSKQHINKFIHKFLDLELIIFSEKIGRSTYYELGPRLNLLSYLMSQK